jgi:glycosyltransferase involved in cell wall biosynthesis
MRILHIVETYYPSIGGMPEVVRRLSEGLVAQRHDVTVATSRHPERKSTIVSGIKIEQFDIAGNYVSGISGTEAEIARFQSLLLHKDFDIITIFAAQHWAADIAFPLLEKMRAKKVFVPTGFSALNNSRFAEYYKNMQKWLQMFNMNIFLSDTYQDIEFARKTGTKNITIIPNGASEKEFSGNYLFNFRRENSLPVDSKLLLLVGSHTGEKGHHEAIKILKRLKSKNVALVIAANTPEWVAQASRSGGIMRKFKQLLKFFLSVFIRSYRTQLRCPQGCLRQALRFNATYRAKRQQKWLFVDSFSREQVVALYQQADIFLFPSNIECSPIVLFEASAGKTAFLASNAGNSAEIAQWTQGGKILPCKKKKDGRTEVIIAESAKITDSLLADDAGRLRMATSGYQSWREKFTWEKIILQYADLYERVLAGKT